MIIITKVHDADSDVDNIRRLCKEYGESVAKKKKKKEEGEQDAEEEEKQNKRNDISQCGRMAKFMPNELLTRQQ